MKLFALRPISTEIAAPRALVFEMAAAVNGSLPGAPPHTGELLKREGNELIVRYRTPAMVTALVMDERVRLEPPERIEYEVLDGPLDHVHERLDFEALDGGHTRVTYTGEVGSSRRIIGEPIARFVAVPAYHRFMLRQLRALQGAAESRAARSRLYRQPDTG